MSEKLPETAEINDRKIIDNKLEQESRGTTAEVTNNVLQAIGATTKQREAITEDEHLNQILTTEETKSKAKGKEAEEKEPEQKSIVDSRLMEKSGGTAAKIVRRVLNAIGVTTDQKNKIVAQDQNLTQKLAEEEAKERTKNVDVAA